jgi:hypothetical protein
MYPVGSPDVSLFCFGKYVMASQKQVLGKTCLYVCRTEEGSVFCFSKFNFLCFRDKKVDFSTTIRKDRTIDVLFDQFPIF